MRLLMKDYDEKDKNTNKNNLLKLVEILTHERVAGKLPYKRQSAVGSEESRRYYRDFEHLVWSPENMAVSLISEGMSLEKANRLYRKIKSKIISKQITNSLGVSSSNHQITLIHPKNEEDFNEQLERWKNEKGPNQVLFIFSPKDGNWQAHFIQNTKKECEMTIIDEKSPFYELLQSFSPDDFVCNIEYDLFLLCIKKDLFGNEAFFKDFKRDFRITFSENLRIPGHCGETIKAALLEADLEYTEWAVQFPRIVSDKMDQKEAETLAQIITSEFQQQQTLRFNKLLDSVPKASKDVVKIFDVYDETVIKARALKDGDFYRVVIDSKEVHEFFKEPERVKAFMAGDAKDTTVVARPPGSTTLSEGVFAGSFEALSRGEKNELVQAAGSGSDSNQVWP